MAAPICRLHASPSRAGALRSSHAFCELPLHQPHQTTYFELYVHPARLDGAVLHALAESSSLVEPVFIASKFTALPFNAFAHFSSDSLITLFNLQILVTRMVYSSDWAPHYFISRLTVPPLLHLNVNFSMGDNDSLSTIFPCLSPTHPILSDLSPISSLLIEIQHHHYTVIIHGHYPPLSRTFFLTLDIYTNQNCIPRILLDLGRLLLPHLESIRLSNFDLESPEISSAFVDFLDCQRDLSEVTFENCHDSFLEEMTASPLRCLCPKLQRLTIKRCPLVAPRLIAIVESRTETSGDDGTIPPLSPLTVQRLQHLHIIGCPQITQSAISELRKRVTFIYEESQAGSVC